MCGIFGIALRQGVIMSSDKVRKLISNLYVLSESRGKESAGIHIYLPDAARAWTLKGAQSASELLRTEAYEEALTQSLLLAYGKGGSSSLLQPMIVLAHSRLVTNGTSSLDRNNQPVRCGDVTMIHNGIVVNVDKLWQANSDLQRTAEVDTEVMAAIEGHF
jgi:glutamine phosphoribosylpyrophosphate amidotransferase